MNKTLVTLKQKSPPIIIDSEENDDWMKTLPGYKDEVAIHEQIAKDLDNGNNDKEMIIVTKG